MLVAVLGINLLKLLKFAQVSQHSTKLGLLRASSIQITKKIGQCRPG